MVVSVGGSTGDLFKSPVLVAERRRQECVGAERFVFVYGTGDAGARLTVTV